MQDMIVSIIVPILTALLSYLGARYQANKELQKVEKNQIHEINKIREESKYEIERLSIELEKQAELYEKNTQTDITADIFSKIMDGDTKSIDNLEKISKMAENEAFKPKSHPTKRRK